MFHQIVNQSEKWNQIIQVLHDEFDYKNKNVMFIKVSQHYWWKKMYQDVKRYMSSCHECQLWVNKQQDEKLHFIWVSVLWEKIAINMIHMSSNQKKRFIIITHNNLSDWSETEVLLFFHLKHVAWFLYKKLICWHECF